MYAWDAETPDDAVPDACGVTDDRAVAIECVRLAVGSGPADARGRVRKVDVSLSGRIVFVDLGVIGEARFDGNDITWTEGWT